ncbi:hypothetical protein KO481_10445 [Nocardia sp. NEAU-G5]|uniref:Uncharacterized protein n=1 Tax=Nocardia albiluteola TaxID=2842303 RepID=A0ABS6AVM4_9NOCA|nr:hypothetical protein [Nocardia albiluteola]MBU3061943.1 hypothetical protein [Nocardia albiluteola]
MELELAVLVGLQASGKSTVVVSRFASTHLFSKDLVGSARDKDLRQRREIAAGLGLGRSVGRGRRGGGCARGAPPSR